MHKSKSQGDMFAPSVPKPREMSLLKPRAVTPAVTRAPVTPGILEDWRTGLDRVYATIEPLARTAATRTAYTEIYLYFKPTDGVTWGEFWIGHEDPPEGFKLVTGERIGGIEFGAIITRYRDILRRLPLIPYKL